MTRARKTIGGLAIPVAVAITLWTGGQAHGQGTTYRGVVVDTFNTPTFVSAAPGRPGLLFVTEVDGVVRVLKSGVKQPRPFLDIRGLVTSGGESGLLSIAFPPGYRKSRRFYVYYTSRRCDSPSVGCDIRVDEFRALKRNKLLAPASSRRRVISIPHPTHSNHYGGQVQIGPDKRLWLATGDGGGGNDPGDNARDLNSLLGKLIRIKPHPRHRPNKPGYAIPADNPYAGVPGRDEIWAYGLRNPYRFSFDARRDAITIGDVGQNTREEVNLLSRRGARGVNFGWPEFDGTVQVDPTRPGADPARPPMYDYPNVGGAAVTGGLIVRDPGLPALAGKYVFADFFAGQPMAFRPNLAANTFTEFETLNGAAQGQGLVAFNAGLSGQVYYLNYFNGNLYRLEQGA